MTSAERTRHKLPYQRMARAVGTGVNKQREIDVHWPQCRLMKIRHLSHCPTVLTITSAQRPSWGGREHMKGMGI